MFFNKKGCLLYLLFINAYNLTAMESDMMEITESQSPPMVHASIPHRKRTIQQPNPFNNFDKNLKQDAELMSFFKMLTGESDTGPLQQTLNLFSQSLSNPEKIYAVYIAIQEILALQESMPFEQYYTQFSELTKNQIAILMTMDKNNLNFLKSAIENNIIFNTTLHDKLMALAKDYITCIVKKWGKAQEPRKQNLALQLIYFSGNEFEYESQNIAAILHISDQELQIFKIRATLNLAITILYLLSDTRAKSEISCIPESPEFTPLPMDLTTIPVKWA